MFDKLLIRMCTFGVIWLTNWNSKLENKYKKNKGEKAVEFHYSPPSRIQKIEEIIKEKIIKLGRDWNTDVDVVRYERQNLWMDMIKKKKKSE